MAENGTHTAGASPEGQQATHDVDVDAAVERIAARASEVREAEAARALRRLEGVSDLDEKERAAVRELAGRLTRSLVAVPAANLAATDAEAAAVALSLFGEGETEAGDGEQ